MKRVFFAALIAAGLASAADQGLLNMVMPDAKVVMGIRVDQTKLSPFGQYMLTHVQSEDSGLQKLMTETGFDPRRNLSEVLAASTGPHQPGSRGLVLARGAFDISRIQSAAQTHGGVLSTWSGVPVIAHTQDHDERVLAFPDNTTAIIGDRASVQGAITRFRGAGALTPEQQKNVQTASADNDVWFITLAPLSQFSAEIPDQSANNAMKGSNLFQTVQQASGGLKFGDPVKLTGEAVTASEKDAQALMDALRFLAGMATMNRQKDPAAGMLASLVDAMQMQTSANTMTVSLSVPEKQLESLIETVHHRGVAPSPTQPNATK